MVGLIKHNVIHVLKQPSDLFQSVAQDFKRRAKDAIQLKDQFSVVLSGGDTPKYFFDVLANDPAFRNDIPWGKIKFFFCDERSVSSDSSKSNYHLADTHLFSKVSVCRENIYKIPTQFKDPDVSAQAYDLCLRSVFQLNDNAFPAFDLVYLGLGEDGHCASLMPFSDLVIQYSQENKEKNVSIDQSLVKSLWFPEQNMYRITLTPPALNHALNVIFLVSGQSKASAVWHVLQGAFDPQKFPAQLIHCVNNDNIWYFDSAAANLLK